MKVYDFMFISESEFVNEAKISVGNTNGCDESYYHLRFMEAIGELNTKDSLLIVLVEKDSEIIKDEEIKLSKVGREYIVKNPVFTKKLLYSDMLVFDNYDVIKGE